MMAEIRRCPLCGSEVGKIGRGFRYYCVNCGYEIVFDKKDGTRYKVYSVNKMGTLHEVQQV